MKKLISILMLISFLIFFRIGFVGGDSMKPILNNMDIIIVSKFSYPDTGDIVVFEHEGKSLVKRVAACNGQYLDENFKVVDNSSSYIPLDNYFMLGDNLSVSIDSRHFGYVDKSKIHGVVILHFSPYVVLAFILLVFILSHLTNKKS